EQAQPASRLLFDSCYRLLSSKDIGHITIVILCMLSDAAREPDGSSRVGSHHAISTVSRGTVRVLAWNRAMRSGCGRNNGTSLFIWGPDERRNSKAAGGSHGRLMRTQHLYRGHSRRYRTALAVRRFF